LSVAGIIIIIIATATSAAVSALYQFSRVYGSLIISINPNAK
jgi:hypothetical protein